MPPALPIALATGVASALDNHRAADPVQMTQGLFESGDLRDYLARRRQAMLDEIERYDRSRFLNSSDDALLEYFLNKYRADAPVLNEDGMTAQECEMRVDVSQLPDRYIRDRSRPLYRPGVQISLLVPFSGEEELLRYSPSTRFTGGGLRAAVEQQQIVLQFSTDTLDEGALHRWKDEVMRTLRQYVAWVGDDVRNWNQSLPDTGGGTIRARRDRILRSQGLVASLGVPLAARPDAPRTFAVSNVVRRTVSPPPAPSTPFQPEPALEFRQFEEILSLIRPVGASIERDPSAFEALNEESLRSLFLATLNSHYRGKATGETFNARGKTDILIRENDRNIFIAECKIWRGAKTLLSALDQLLSYATWRDGKLALILFVRQRGFADVLGQIPALVQGHAAYRRGLRAQSESEWICTVASDDDPSRQRTLAVLAFHCPARGNKAV